MTSDADLVARVREAIALLPPILLRDGDGRLMQHEAATSAQQALDTLARRLEELADSLKQTVAEENTTPHHHRRAATWDDNGKPCSRCLMFDRARQLLSPSERTEE